MDRSHWHDLLGVRYERDGTDPATGLGCVGLVLVVVRRRGYAVPDLTVAEVEAGRWADWFEAVDPASAAVGDVVAFELPGGPHVGVVVAPERVLHAADPGGVVLSRLGSAARLRGAYRPRAAAAHGELARPSLPPGMVAVRLVADVFAPGGRETVLARAAERASVAALLPPGYEGAAVSLNGRRLPREEWGAVVPEAGDEVVALRIPGFGAAFFTALGATEGGALVTATGGLTVLGAIVSVAASIVVGIGLSFVSTLLVGTPRAGRGESDENSPTYNLSGIRNSLRPGGPIPVVYGTATVGGQIVQIFLDVDGEGRSVLYVLIAISQGEIESIAGLGEVDELEGSAIPTALQINGNPARNYANVRVSTRLGRTDQAPIPGFRDVVTSTPYEVTLDDNVPFTHTTGGKVDGFQLNFFWPRGLTGIDDDGGGPFNHYVDFTVEWRVVGTATWATSGVIRIERSTLATFNSKFRKDGLARDRYEVRVTRVFPAWPETSEFYLSDMVLNSVNEIVSDDLAYPDVALVGWRAVASNQLSGGVPTFTHGSVKGKKVQVWDGVSTTAPTFTKQWSESPAWCAFDVLTNRRYGLGNFFDASSGYLQTVADAETFLAETVSDGRGGTHRRGVCNFVVDTTKKGWDVAAEILTPYRVTPILYGRRFRFRVEKSAADFFGIQWSQLFTMGNIRQGSFRMRRSDPALAANVVEVQYWDEEKNFEPDVETRQNDAALQAGARVVKATISVPAVSHRSRAARIAQFRLNVETAGLHVIEFEAGIDAVAVEPGDVFAFQHDLVDEHVGGRFHADATGTGVYFDRGFTVPAPDVRWALVARSATTAGGEFFQTVYVPAGTYAAGALVSITDALGGALTMTTPPKRGDVYACGPALSVVRYYRAVDLTLTPRLHRRILAVEYDDDIYDDDPGSVATATDVIPNRGRHPVQVTGLVAREYAERTAFGAYVNRLAVSWQVGGDAPTCDVYLRRLGRV